MAQSGNKQGGQQQQPQRNKEGSGFGQDQQRKRPDMVPNNPGQEEGEEYQAPSKNPQQTPPGDPSSQS